MMRPHLAPVEFVLAWVIPSMPGPKRVPLELGCKPADVPFSLVCLRSGKHVHRFLGGEEELKRRQQQQQQQRASSSPDGGEAAAIFVCLHPLLRLHHLSPAPTFILLHPCLRPGPRSLRLPETISKH